MKTTVEELSYKQHTAYKSIDQIIQSFGHQQQMAQLAKYQSRTSKHDKEYYQKRNLYSQDTKQNREARKN